MNNVFFFLYIAYWLMVRWTLKLKKTAHFGNVSQMGGSLIGYGNPKILSSLKRGGGPLNKFDQFSDYFPNWIVGGGPWVLENLPNIVFAKGGAHLPIAQCACTPPARARISFLDGRFWGGGGFCLAWGFFGGRGNFWGREFFGGREILDLKKV